MKRMSFVFGLMLALPAMAVSIQDVQKNLGRYDGQKEFLTPGYSYQSTGLRATPMGAPAAANAPGGAPKRDVQESDVYKVGSQGSRLLYLLNTSRGLQVVRYDQDATPRLIARLEATGNYPSDMYFMESRQRLVVLEHVYFSSNSYSYSEEQSRLVVYDVSDPQKPKIQATIPFKGYFEDSKMVGDVLYIGSRLNPDNRSSDKYKGLVASFDINADKIKLIEQVELKAPVNYGDALNIIEIPQSDNTFKYYLAAPTTDWNFYSAAEPKTYVELIDITDPKGHITSVMRAMVRGEVSKKSQMMIKDDTLIVVSNFNMWSRDPNEPAEIAVETFVLPASDSVKVRPSTAAYRAAWLADQLDGGGPLKPNAIDSKIDDLQAANPQMSMKGVFIQNDVLEKVFPDSRIIAGDSNNQNANLRDVRADGNLLYAFWVPANNVDPLDVFDISNPKKGVTHLNRTQFDGWVDRSVPFTYQNRKFLLGLGYEFPTINNEERVRKAHAMLFEIIDHRGKPTPDLIQQMELTEKNAYADFGYEDKLLEFQLDDKGQGQLLFTQGAVANGKWTDGGKMVLFDMTKIDTDADHVFTEGPFIVGNSDYLRRIFTDKDIQRVNTFSDKQLVVYDTIDPRAQNFVNAVKFLELARNIQSYVVTGHGTNAKGVQIVSSPNYFWAQSDDKTELRFVPINQPDQEWPDQDIKDAHVADLVKLPGNYVAHDYDEAHNRLVVLTSEHTSAADKTTNTHRVFAIDLGVSAKIASTPAEWSEVHQGQNSPRFGFRPGWYYSKPTFEKIGDGTYLVTSGDDVRSISIDANGPKADVVTTTGCAVSTDQQPLDNTHMALLSGNLYWMYSQSTMLNDNQLAFTKNFVAPVTMNGGQAVCGTAVNIPGRAIAAIGDQLVSQDTWVLDTISFQQKDWQDATKVNTYWEFVTTSGLTSVQMTAATGELKDLVESPALGSTKLTPLKDNSFLAIESPKCNDYYCANYPSVHQLQFLSLNNYKFQRQVKGVYLSTSESLDLQSLFENPSKPGEYLAVLKTWTDLRVIKFDLQNLRPEIVNLKANAGDVAVEALAVPGIGWMWQPTSAVNYTPETQTLELSLGLAGVKQLMLQ